MNKLKLLLINLILYPLFCFSENNYATKEHMLQDLDIIKSTLEVKYAPKEWKNALFGWDLFQEIDYAKEKVALADLITIKDYQRMVKKFFNSMQDYHVGVIFSSTEKATLPLSIQSANGHYFVIYIEQELKKINPKIQVGDEVLAIDGRPVSECVAELLDSEFGPSGNLTDRRLAEHALTIRLGTRGNVIPQGDTVYTIKSKITNEIFDCELTWSYYPEMIKGDLFNPNNKVQHFVLDKDNFHQHPLFYKKWSTPLVDILANAKKQIDLFEKNAGKNDWAHEFFGYKTSRLPRPKMILWNIDKPENEKHFDAYIYRNAKGKKVGFIRIATYSPPLANYNQLLEEFDEIMSIFESYTDCLVIDQLDNPGGAMFYMYALLSRLTDKPFKLFTNRETLTQQDVINALEVKSYFEDDLAYLESNGIVDDCTDIAGYTLNVEDLKNMCKYFEFIVNEWNSGRVISNSSYLYGLEQIRPNAYVHYSKPILILVNENDFSCGDIFPAIMQDNKRATLMGTTTAGAGGYVLSNSHFNMLGIRSYNFTGSIAERPDGTKIENLGITPDISYTLTEKDLVSGYMDFAKEIDNVINTVILK